MLAGLLLALGQYPPLWTVKQINTFHTEADLAALQPHNAQIDRIAGTSSHPQPELAVTFQPSEWPNVGIKPFGQWDWSKAAGIAMEVTNPGSAPVTLGIRMDDDPSANGWDHSLSGTTTVPGSATETVLLRFGSDPASSGMRGLPPVKGVVTLQAQGASNFNTGHVVALQMFLHRPAVDTKLIFANLDAVVLPPIAGIVDEFGQFSQDDWPGKVHTVQDLVRRSSAERKAVMETPAAADRDRFGGWKSGPTLSNNGFFRTAQSGGKWWLVDPDGHLFFSFGVDTVALDESSMVTGREKLFEWLPKDGSDQLHMFEHNAYAFRGPVTTGQAFNFYGANVYRALGAGYRDAWPKETIDRLLSWGYNTVGNWSDEGFIGNGRIPYVATAGTPGKHAKVSSGSDYWGQMSDPFDPQFAADVASGLAPVVQRVKADPWCVGYFVDNELSWAGEGPDGRYGLAIGTLGAPAGQPAKAALLAQLRKKYDAIDGLNNAWGSSFGAWDALRGSVKLPSPLSPGERQDLGEFVYTFALNYFTTIRDELKRLDPNHLYLGCRFAWSCPEAEKAASEVVDVVSFNIYAKDIDTPRWHDVAKLGKPCVIGEFHFGALDRGMFHPGLVDAGTQQGRADLYRKYVTSVLQNPAFVGCHWFQYTDEPVAGRTWDGENYNIGLVSVTDLAYPELTAAAKSVQGDGYRIRNSGGK